MPRIDEFMKNTGLFRSRSQARQACNEGIVSLGGKRVVASATVKPGDIMSINRSGGFVKIEVLRVPERPVARRQRETCYRILERKSRSREAVLSFDDPIELRSM